MSSQLLGRLFKSLSPLIFTVIFVMSLHGQVWAQTSTPAAKAEKDKRKTSIDFEDELIQGEIKKPELFYLLQKKQFNFKRLIKLREDFLPEMRRTSQDIRRSGSGN